MVLSTVGLGTLKKQKKKTDQSALTTTENGCGWNIRFVVVHTRTCM